MSVAATVESIVAVIAVGVLPPVTARSSQLPPEFVLGATDAVVPLGKVTVTVWAGGPRVGRFVYTDAGHPHDAETVFLGHIDID